MPRSFDFDASVERYYQRSRGRGSSPYPRLRAWEFLWDWVQGPGSWTRLATKPQRQTTALHLGFYLANWGMFRGSGRLHQQNLEFFEDLVEHLFSGERIPAEFWSLRLEDFAGSSGTEHQDQAAALFDGALKALKAFKSGGVSWTDTLTTKALLGLWGQTPAFDRYFIEGLSSFLEGRPKVHFRGLRAVTAHTLVDLARLAKEHAWGRGKRYLTANGRHPYPLGKVIDMAFFQFGAEPYKEGQPS